MVPLPVFVSYLTGFVSSTNSRDEPSASVSNPGIVASGASDFTWWETRVVEGPGPDFFFGSDQPKPVAGTTAWGEAVSEVAVPVGVAVVVVVPVGVAVIVVVVDVSTSVAAGLCATAPAGTRPRSATTSAWRPMNRMAKV